MANKDYSKKQLIEMGACTNCQFCAQVCPTVAAAQDGNLSAVYRIEGLKKIVRSRNILFRKLFRSKELSEDQWKHFSDTVFKCTLCGHCQEVCPVGIHLKDLWVSVRQGKNRRNRRYGCAGSGHLVPAMRPNHTDICAAQ